jgi:hypothetical protein
MTNTVQEQAKKLVEQVKRQAARKLGEVGPGSTPVPGRGGMTAERPAGGAPLSTPKGSWTAGRPQNAESPAVIEFYYTDYASIDDREAKGAVQSVKELISGLGAIVTGVEQIEFGDYRLSLSKMPTFPQPSNEQGSWALGIGNEEVKEIPLFWHNVNGRVAELSFSSEEPELSSGGLGGDTVAPPTV